jgi:hypothetical protein
MGLTDSNQAEDICPARFFAPSGPANRRINVAEKKKGRTMNPLIQSKNTTILPVLIAVTLGCFGLSPQSRAVCQEGCLTNENTVLGEDALLHNTTGFENTAVGFNALLSNIDGSSNTAIGFNALTANNFGLANTAIGSEALLNNTNGEFNTAVGLDALLTNTLGADNTAIGGFALERNTDGNSNTAIGEGALLDNSTGSANTAIGDAALANNKTGRNNVALGAEAGINHATGNNNIYILSRGFPGEDNTIRIGEPPHGRTFIAGISGVTVAGGVGVIVDTNGQLGTVVSSERFKDATKPMEQASEAIFSLKPVTFRYKHELDPKGIPQFGLVAEDVEKVNPDLVARDDQGKPYTVRYEAVNAMLLNEFLKEHHKVEKLEATVLQQRKDLQATVAELRSALKKQAAQIQKVSAQLAITRPPSRMIVNDQ